MVLVFEQVFQRTKITMIRTYTPHLVFFVERKKTLILAILRITDIGHFIIIIIIIIVVIIIKKLLLR